MRKKGKLIYEDEAGNKLYEKRIIRHGRPGIQYSAYNAEGKLVDEEGLAIMMRRAGVNRGYMTQPLTRRGARILGRMNRFKPFYPWW